MKEQQKTPTPLFCKRLIMASITLFVAALTATVIQYIWRMQRLLLIYGNFFHQLPIF